MWGDYDGALVRIRPGEAFEGGVGVLNTNTNKVTLLILEHYINSPLKLLCIHLLYLMLAIGYCYWLILSDPLIAIILLGTLLTAWFQVCCKL